MMCTVFHACDSREVIHVLTALGFVFTLISFSIAAIVRAWRVGSTDRNIDAIIRGARYRAYRDGREDA